MDDVSEAPRARLTVEPEGPHGEPVVRLAGELDIAGLPDVAPGARCAARARPRAGVGRPDRPAVPGLLRRHRADPYETAALLVSELATNTVRYASGQFEVAVRHTAQDDVLWIGVTDAGPGDPLLQTPAVTEERGRGLPLVSALADRWGVWRRRGSEEKTVWFELTPRAVSAG